MAKSYGPEAIEECRRLYLKYGGNSHDAIQRDMRRAGYSGWNKLNLHTRGKEGTRNERIGWIEKYGFDNSLRLHLEQLVSKVNDDVQDLYLGIRTIRKQLQAEAIGRNASKDVRREFREYSKLEIEARRNLDLTRANLDTFAEAYELIVTWAPDIDAELAKRLVKNGDRFADLAEAHYGKAETSDDGGSESPDEGGDGPDADEDSLDRFVR